jgi:hypothetical protein
LPNVRLFGIIITSKCHEGVLLPMLGFKRRKRVEGWAIDVPDGDTERPGMMRRIADNNKAWLVCLAGLVVLTLFLVKMSNHTIGGDLPAVEPVRAPTEFRDRTRYSRFEQDFRTDRRFAEAVVEDRFLSPGRLRVVVASGVSADEIEYLAKWAAERIRYVFHHRTVVQVYKNKGSSGESTLIAITRWEPKKGGYTVSFQAGSRRSN